MFPVGTIGFIQLPNMPFWPCKVVDSAKLENVEGSGDYAVELFLPGGKTQLRWVMESWGMVGFDDHVEKMLKNVGGNNDLKESIEYVMNMKNEQDKEDTDQSSVQQIIQAVRQRREKVKLEEFQFSKINTLKPVQGMHIVHVKFIVLERYPPIQTKKDTIDQFLVADETAAIRLSLFEGKGMGIYPGDVFLLHWGHCAPWKGQLTLYTGRKGLLTRIGRFNMIFNESRNMSDETHAT